MASVIRTALILALAALGAPAAAHDAKGNFAVDGVGNRTCKQFTQALSGNQKLAVAFAGWTDGFMSATNALSPDTFDLTPWETVEVILAKMKTYCTANPEEIYVKALAKLIATLRPARLTEQSEIVRVAVGNKGIFVYRSVLERIRAQLLERGYKVSKTEGVYEGDFINALRSFQQDNDIPVTGLPDQPTMIKMFP